MFDKVRAGIFIAIILIMAMGGGVIKYQYSALKHEEEKNVVLTEMYSTLINTNRNLIASQKVTEAVVEKVDAKTLKLDDNYEKVVTVAEKKIAKVRKGFSIKALTPADLVQEDTLISTIRIESVWEIYCFSEPDNVECQRFKIPVESDLPTEEVVK
jgi:hypothetical protein